MRVNGRSGRSVSDRFASAGPRRTASAFLSGGLAAKISRNLRDYGWRVTLQKSVAYLVRGIYFRQAYRIYRIRLDSVGTADRSEIHDLTFRILTPEDTEVIAQVEEIAEWL